MRDKQSGPVKVDGVSKWLVPENNIFDVQCLPSNLQKLSVKTPYISFDLLCIPQDRSHLPLREIARQVVIFRGAQHAIAWLNMIPDWSGLKATTEWMCLQYLTYSDFGERSSQARIHADHIFAPASGSTNLFKPYKYGPAIPGFDLRPSAWFTSLWTLQEVCLRPDMLLCSKDWDVLTVGGDEPVPIPSPGRAHWPKISRGVQNIDLPPTYLHIHVFLL